MHLVELLVENGAEIAAVPFEVVLRTWDPKIIRFFSVTLVSNQQFNQAPEALRECDLKGCTANALGNSERPASPNRVFDLVEPAGAAESQQRLTLVRGQAGSHVPHPLAVAAKSEPGGTCMPPRGRRHDTARL